MTLLPVVLAFGIMALVSLVIGFWLIYKRERLFLDTFTAQVEQATNDLFDDIKRIGGLGDLSTTQPGEELRLRVHAPFVDYLFPELSEEELAQDLQELGDEESQSQLSPPPTPEQRKPTNP